MSDSTGITHGNLFVVSAPSGAGKTSLVTALVERDPTISLSVSHTTRARRCGEVDGQHYHFVDRQAFENKMSRGDFIEQAEVFGNYYGTDRIQLQKKLSVGQDVILEIDWQGARQVRSAMTRSFGIFILPPSRNILHDRLEGRGTDSAEVIASRMHQAEEEISHHQEFDYLVINDLFQTALSQLHAIVTATRLRHDIQLDRHQNLLSQLLTTHS